MVHERIYTTFKAGSRTYFYSSLFFPEPIKNDVFILYGFVRKADNYVDNIPADSPGFYRFKDLFYQSLEGTASGDIIIDSFTDLLRRRDFEPAWVDAFLASMEMDLTKKIYHTLDETLRYIYGSAEVIGLMMAKIMGLPEDALPYAQYLGRAMQYINFIRDISEDNTLGRIYFPQDRLAAHDLMNLDYDHTRSKPERFRAFIREEIKRYCDWQSQAEKGFSFIPRRFLIPVKTASEMYKWTGKKITRHPFIVYQKKVKPLIPRIVVHAVFSTFQKSVQTTSCAGFDFHA
jgi:phytoene synthase